MTRVHEAREHQLCKRGRARETDGHARQRPPPTAWSSPLPRLAQIPQRRGAGAARRAVDDEHALEMVVLVLDHPRLDAVGDELQARRTRRRRARADDRAGHRHRHAGHAQTTLVQFLDLIRERVEHGVHEHLRIVVDIVDEQTLQHAHLGRRQADPGGVVHDPDACVWRVCAVLCRMS